MDLAVVAIYAVVMIGGVALGMLLSVAGPRDEEAAAMHRQQARRAMAWLPDRSASNHVRAEPKS